MEKNDIANKSKSEEATCEGEGNKRIKWSLTDLAPELLEEIMRRMSLVDQIRFRSTCRYVHSRGSVVPTDQLPWLFAGDKFGSYTLRDPSNDRTHTVNIEPQDPASIIFINLFVFASKFGWLLLYNLSTNTLFFFNPFNKGVIQVPRLTIHQCQTATFSSPPTQPDCIVIALCEPETGTKITICHLKDKKWTTYECDTNFEDLVRNVVYLKRKFYSVEGNGALGIFSLDEEKWTYHPGLEVARPCFERTTYLIEGDGEIHLVIISCGFTWIRVFRLDFAEMRWVKVEKLKNRSLFLTGYTSIAAHTTVREMRNRFHHYEDNILMYYSLKARRCYTCTKYYGEDAADERLDKIWIQPPF